MIWIVIVEKGDLMLRNSASPSRRGGVSIVPKQGGVSPDDTISGLLAGRLDAREM